MNLGGIDFFDAHEQLLPREDIVISAELSSIYGGKSSTDVWNAFIDGRLLHSLRELSPSLTIKLRKSTYISVIKVKNRNDINRDRSRFLTVTTRLGKKTIQEWHNYDQAQKEQELLKLLSVIDYNIENSQTINQYVNEVRERIMKLILSDMFPLDIKQAIQLIPILDRNAIFTDFDLLIVAYIAVKMKAKSFYLDTYRLEPFAKVLGSDISILRFSHFVSKIINAKSADQSIYSLTKHRLQTLELICNKETYLSHLDRFFELSSQWNITSTLCYGTLLGAGRNEEFIPHDDDVDVLYFDGASSLDDALINRAILIQKLQDNGFEVICYDLNFNIFKDGIAIDVFPSWIEGDRLFLMMENFEVRSISKDIIFPLGEVKLYDRIYPAPRSIDDFLVERYGQTWTIADPYHEWPWPIIRRKPNIGGLYAEFKLDLNSTLKDYDYAFDKSKEQSCDWIIDRLVGRVGVDVGGTSYLVNKIKLKYPQCDITYFDLFPPHDESIKKYIQADMSEFGNYFKQKSLDFITTRHTLEHCTDPLYQLWQYNRCLKDEGLLYIIIPNSTNEWVWFYSHFSCLPRENWLMLFYRSGFKVLESDAGTWNKNNPDFIEFRFTLQVDSRGFRL
jgi:SAM-dependent methyltransferase